MIEKEKMRAGLPYQASDPELKQAHMACARLLKSFNDLGPEKEDEADRLIRALVGSAGDNILVTQPFHCDYGFHIFVGDHFFANFNLVILDVAEVRIGNNVMLGPNVGLYTAGHPIHPDGRNAGWEWGAPITIGDNVWLGGNVVVNPGVTIGDNVVVGAGSVVTKDLPSWTVCAGTPCRVIRTITPDDREVYRKGHKWPDDIRI